MVDLLCRYAKAPGVGSPQRKPNQGRSVQRYVVVWNTFLDRDTGACSTARGTLSVVCRSVWRAAARRPKQKKENEKKKKRWVGSDDDGNTVPVSGNIEGCDISISYLEARLPSHVAVQSRLLASRTPQTQTPAASLVHAPTAAQAEHREPSTEGATQ